MFLLIKSFLLFILVSFHWFVLPKDSLNPLKTELKLPSLDELEKEKVSQNAIFTFQAQLENEIDELSQSFILEKQTIAMHSRNMTRIVDEIAGLTDTNQWSQYKEQLEKTWKKKIKTTRIVKAV